MLAQITEQLTVASPSVSWM